MPGWLIDHFLVLTFRHASAQHWAPECP